MKRLDICSQYSGTPWEHVSQEMSCSNVSLEVTLAAVWNRGRDQPGDFPNWHGNPGDRKIR